MKSLLANECAVVAGGVSCVNSDTIQNVNDKAVKDGILLSALIVPVTMALTLGVTASVPITAATGIILAPYTMIAGYSGSSGWNLIS